MRTRILISVFTGMALLIGLGGCGGAVKQITAESQGMRTDVFIEVKEQQPPPKGTVDLTIKASVKTPPEGYYLFGERTHPQGKDSYPFELNIDGQEIVWKGQGKSETTPRWDENGRIIPEGGGGIRYVLDKKIRLRPGFHHVVFGLPDENYFTEVRVSLREGEPHTLEFQPLYVMGRKHHRSFYHGIKSYDAFLDGAYIK
jgi:hypothetical protein